MAGDAAAEPHQIGAARRIADERQVARRAAHRRQHEDAEADGDEQDHKRSARPRSRMPQTRSELQHRPSRRQSNKYLMMRRIQLEAVASTASTSAPCRRMWPLCGAIDPRRHRPEAQHPCQRRVIERGQLARHEIAVARPASRARRPSGVAGPHRVAEHRRRQIGARAWPCLLNASEPSLAQRHHHQFGLRQGQQLCRMRLDRDGRAAASANPRRTS